MTDCLDYMSCVGSLAYFNWAPDEYSAINICNNSMIISAQALGSSITYVGQQAWSLANTIKTDLEYKASMGMPAKETLYPATYTAFLVCQNIGWRTVTPTKNEYYQVLIIVDDSQYRLGILMINCPDGGVADNKYGIENCHIDTFSDTTGSGVYQNGCYYTE